VSELTPVVRHPRDCKHGHLARTCELCALERENAELRDELGRIPDALRHWFGGHSVLAEEFGLPRISSRHRVVEVLADLGDPGRPHIAKGEWREFKNGKAADRLRDQWAREGRVVILQHAVVWWLTADELPG
jgi:hypothetical protein